MLRKLTLLIIPLLFFFIPSVPVFAQNSQDQSRPAKIVTLPADQIVAGDYFAAGDQVEIFGTVNGDLYAAGGQIIINGAVNGDVLAAGGTVDIAGKVSQNVRIVGGQININGEIGRNLTIGGGNVNLSNAANIKGSAAIGAGNVTLAGPIAGDLRIGAGNLIVSNDVRGDIEAALGQIRLTSKAHVYGNLNYWSDSPASVDSTAKIDGQVQQNKPIYPEISPKKAAGAVAGIYLWFKFISFLSALVIGWLIASLLPRFSLETASLIRRRPWASLGIGFLALILTPILIIVMAFTVVGFVPALLLGMSFMIALYLAKIFVAYSLGTVLIRSEKRTRLSFVTYLAGLFSLYVFTSIPLIGKILSFLVILGGLGALLISKRDLYLTLRKKESL